MAVRGALPSVLVVGAGPVGLYLAARLGSRGFPTTVVERRAAPAAGSRAIGVHPPGVAALQAVGVLEAIRRRAVPILRARALGADGVLATLDLRRAGEVLAVPQEAVEAALEARVAELDTVQVVRGRRLCGLEAASAAVDALVESAGGVERMRFEVVVGCDGRASVVRAAAGIGVRGGPYGDRYLMADLPRDDDDGVEALVALHRAGVVEAFPLLGARRWVAHAGFTGDPFEDDDRRDPLGRLLALLRERLAVELDRPSTTRASGFAVERLLADRFARGRVALAGDAAHVVSPIGGQGMNLGWLDAAALVGALAAADGDVPGALAGYAARRRRAAVRAIRRAALNTHLGRPMARATAAVRDALLRRALRPPFERFAVAAFTMRGLA